MTGPPLVVLAGAVGLLAAAAGVAWGRAVPKVDPVGRPCPGCDGRAGLPGAAAPWRVPSRCPGCGRTVRGPTLLVEVTGGLALAVLAAAGDVGWLLAADAWLVAVLVALVWADARYRLLPARIVWWGGGGSLPLLALAEVSGSGSGATGRAVAAAAAAGLVVLGLHLLQPEGLAFGDVRLAVLLGLVVGWRSGAAVPWVLVVASALAGGWGWARARRGHGHIVPFGPFLALAAAVVLVLVAPGG